MKILISDLDGTIYRNKNVLAPDLKKLNEFIVENMLVIATGRNEFSFSFFTNQFDLSYSYVILCNGALIKDKNHQTIIQHSFNKTDDILQIFKIIDQFQKYQISVSLSFEDGILNFPKYQSKFYEQIKTNLNYGVIGIAIEIINCSIAVVDKLYQQLPKDLSFCVERNNQYIDIIPKGISKKSAIIELMNKYNFNKNDIYMIGDYYNDLSMFEINDNSFIINNDIEELNNSAKYVVDSICDCIDIINNENNIKK